MGVRSVGQMWQQRSGPLFGQETEQRYSADLEMGDLWKVDAADLRADAMAMADTTVAAGASPVADDLAPADASATMADAPAVVDAFAVGADVAGMADASAVANASVLIDASVAAGVSGRLPKRVAGLGAIRYDILVIATILVMTY